MKEMYLPSEYSVKAAEIFLNIFGLHCNSYDNHLILPNSTIEIWNSNEKKGTLTFQNNQFQIQVNTPFGHLVAHSNLPKKVRISDERTNEFLDTWNHDISFGIQNGNEDSQMSGEIRIACRDDIKYGKTCTCIPALRLARTNPKTNQDEIVWLNFLQKGSAFNIQSIAPSYKERILVSPLTLSTLFMEHDKWENGLRHYASVFQDGKNKNRFVTLQIETENDKDTFWNRQVFSKDSSQENRRYIVQKGLLMQQTDSDYLQAIERFRKCFQKEDVSILDNLITICLGPYSDEEVLALTGNKKRKIPYHESVSHVRDFYFSDSDTKSSQEESPRVFTLHKNLEN